MTVAELIDRLVCVQVHAPEAEVVVADSPFCDGDIFTIDLVTEDEQGRVVLSPDVVLMLREEPMPEVR